MNHVLLACVLLAQQDPLQNIAEEFKGREARLESGYLWTGLWILLGIVAALFLLAKLFHLCEKRRPTNSSIRLFLSLCRAHRLRWSERWLLWRVAREQQLKDPGRLFLEPERLDPANLSPVLQLRAARLEGIRSRLFAGVPTEDAPPPEQGQAAGASPSPQTAGGALPVVPTAQSPASDVPSESSV